MEKRSSIKDSALRNLFSVTEQADQAHQQPGMARSGEGGVQPRVANIPGAFPRTSTFALTNATFPYILQIADKGYEKALQENEALRKGLNLIDGKLVCQGVANSFGMSFIQNPFD